jgi:hypothetical protein
MEHENHESDIFATEKHLNDVLDSTYKSIMQGADAKKLADAGDVKMSEKELYATLTKVSHYGADYERVKHLLERCDQSKLIKLGEHLHNSLVRMNGILVDQFAVLALLLNGMIMGWHLAQNAMVDQTTKQGY